ncbi:MAG: hypothetical protein WBL50_12465 [Candidatus Acidiferrum sp.]
MTRFLFFVSFVFSALLAGCDDATMMKRYAPLQDEPVARKYPHTLRERNRWVLRPVDYRRFFTDRRIDFS